jgi:putative membrane protein insertion efficiency factor
VSFLWETLIGLPSWLLIAAVRLYQLTLSPLIGQQCRFSPTCSNYMIQAVLKHGFLIGLLKGIWRILRCNPFCRGGHDPP